MLPFENFCPRVLEGSSEGKALAEGPLDLLPPATPSPRQSVQSTLGGTPLESKVLGILRSLLWFSRGEVGFFYPKSSED